MPLYQNYFPQMNNGYNPQMQNPYQQRVDFLQGYQQSLQQPVQQMSPVNQQPNFMGKIVDSVDIVKATDIPMDGNMYYFPKADGTEIFGKQWLTSGQTRILAFKPVLEPDPNNSTSEPTESIPKPFKAFSEVFEKRFDELTGKIDKLERSVTKTTASKTKKESDSE